MYSIVLMLAVQSPAEAPAGVLFNRAGCGGGAVRAVLAAQPVRTFLFRRLGAARGFRLFGFRFREVHRYSVTAPPGTAAVPLNAQSAVAEELRFGFVSRARVRVQLNAALRRADAGELRLSLKHRQAVRKALDDPDVFEVAVVKVHRDMKKGVQRAIGDGTLLKLIIDNLPALIDALLRIIDALSLNLECPNWYSTPPPVWAMAA